MINEKNFSLTKLLVGILCTIILCCSLFLIFHESNLVYAEYEDIINNPTSIVNFNQLVHNDSARENTTAGLNFTYVGNGVVHVYGDYTNNYGATYRFYASPYSFDMLENHYYYIYVGNVDTINYKLMVSSGDYAVKSLTSRGNIYYSPNNRAMHIGVSVQPSNSYDFYASTYVVDLTQCFGIGNEPNLEQANDYFISNYYPYNEGTPISISGVNDYYNGYGNGYNDALSSYELMTKYVQNTGSVITSMTDVNINNYYFSELYRYSNNVAISNLWEDRITTAYMPFLIPLEQNQHVKVRGKFSHNDGNYSLNVNLGYYDNNTNSMITLSTFSCNGGSNTPFNVEFDLPTNISGLYIYLDSVDSITLSSTEFVVEYLDINPLLISDIAYDDGFYTAEGYYVDYYEKILAQYNVGGSEYNRIFNLGHTAGVNDQDIYNFRSLIFSAIEAPINAIFGVFDFDFMGYNLKNVLSAILVILVVISFIRLLLGGF